MGRSQPDAQRERYPYCVAFWCDQKFRVAGLCQPDFVLAGRKDDCREERIPQGVGLDKQGAVGFENKVQGDVGSQRETETGGH